MDNLYIVKEFNENYTVFLCVINNTHIEKIINKDLSGIFSINDVVSEETILVLEKI